MDEEKKNKLSAKGRKSFDSHTQAIRAGALAELQEAIVVNLMKLVSFNDAKDR